MASLNITPLGGLGEVGKNLMVYESAGEIVVVDAGLAFPRDEHLGVDLVLPDISYLRDRADRIRAVLLTHAHEDHVGALPYLMREVNVPEVWGTRLTLGLLQPKLDEHGLGQATELREARPDEGAVEIGSFRAEFIRMAHSVPDTVAIALEVGGLRILHTGDYKLDHTPVDGLRTDVGKLAEIGNRGVDLMLGDSTNAERPASPAPSGSSARLSARSSPRGRGACSLRASPRMCTGCSRPSTWPSRPGARSASSGARCGRT